MAFMNAIAVIKEDGTLKVDLYRKFTHIDQSSNLAFNLLLEHKLGVRRNLYHRARTAITKDDYVHRALTNCGYKGWLLHTGEVQSKL